MASSLTAEEAPSLGVLFAKNSSKAERLASVKEFGTATRARLSGAAGAAGHGRDVLAERSAQILSETAVRLPIRTAETLSTQYGGEPEMQAQAVIAEAGRLVGLVWIAAAAVPGPPPVIQAMKAVIHSAIEIKMIGELYAIYADGADRDANWLGRVLASWAIGQPVAPGGSVASTTALLVAKVRGSAEELVGHQSRTSVVTSKGREGTDLMARAGARMQRRMRLHPSSWAQLGHQSAGAIVLGASARFAAGKLERRAPSVLVGVSRDRLAPAASPARSEAVEAAPDDLRPAFAQAWTLHRQAAVAAVALPESDPTVPRLRAALAAQEHHLQDLARRLGEPPSIPVARGGGGGNAGSLTWQGEDAIDVVEDLGARPRRLRTWSTRRRAALVYAITAMVVSALPAVGLALSSGFGVLAVLVVQCGLLPLLSLAFGAIAIGSLFRPALAGPVPRHPVIGTWTVFAVHLGVAVLAAVIGTFT